ncbi:uncharacterized protein K452DRAFT_116846 [Aplosporella prunicola CBS 121167]|uniref:G-patch domain-containing protein n=1 Tax=Aplosporella prunicola CBS 121167 TaxID=1176127 RepID=A0A6A6B1K6_9PEZI|nr:uncharacterized protein K452DRAFT_116846 [Aplosporella prunicola CBS 121167]KAF2136897.1 hypothetical protein K452DRAFT_116846 [Aplosporella prunicola CBS 121167]
MLVVQSLKPTTDEELFAKGIMKLYKSEEEEAADKARQSSTGLKSTSTPRNFGARKDSLKRVFLIRAKDSGESCGYGLAEFHTIEDAKAAYAKYSAMKNFTIGSKDAFVSYAHLGVFIPAFEDGDPAFTFQATADQTMRLQYRDPRLFGREHTVTHNPPEVAESSTPQQKEDQQGKAKAEQDAKAKNKKRKAEEGVSVSNKKPTIIMADKFSQWNQREKEQRKDVQNPPPVTRPKPSMSADGLVDFAGLKCYVCLRNFKTLDLLNVHIDGSDLHANRLKDESAIVKGWERLKKDKPDTVIPKPGSEQHPAPPQRRQNVANNPDVLAQNGQSKPLNAEKPKPSANDGPKQPVDKEPKLSKGEKLMAKIGFKGGSLGASGEGITAAIQPQMYRPGVGLGAEGGKLGDALEVAEKSYVEKGRDSARERFEQLSRDRN